MLMLHTTNGFREREVATMQSDQVTRCLRCSLVGDRCCDLHDEPTS